MDASQIQLMFEEIYDHLVCSSDKIVLVHVLVALHEICKKFPLEQETSKFFLKLDYLSPFIADLLENSRKILLNESSDLKNKNVAKSASLAIGTMMDHSAIDCSSIIENFLYQFCKSFDLTLDVANFQGNKEQQEFYQGLITSIIASALVIRRFHISPEQGKNIFEMIDKSFIDKEDFYLDGIMAISALSLCKFFLNFK